VRGDGGAWSCVVVAGAGSEGVDALKLALRLEFDDGSDMVVIFEVISELRREA
jgi:hypothetical protein